MKGAKPLLPPAARRARVQAVLADLLTELAVAKPTSERIHRIRVAVKKLRAWIRLLRLAEQRRVGVAADRELRALARAFAATRDRQVLRRTLELLLADCANDAEATRIARLSPQLLPPATAIDAPALAQTSIRRLQGLCARQPEDAAVLRGLARSYRRVRRLGKRACARTATAELRHRWRKRVKYLLYQARFVCALRRGKFASWQKTLAELGAALGDLQDIHVLERRLEALVSVVDAVTLKRAVRLVARARKRRLAAVMRLQKRCFADRHPPIPA